LIVSGLLFFTVFWVLRDDVGKLIKHDEDSQKTSSFADEATRIAAAGDYSFQILSDLYSFLPVREQQIVFIGNSHVHDYHWNELPLNHAIVNRGIRGTTTKHTLLLIQSLPNRIQKAYVIQVGTNEILMGHHLESIKQDFSALADTIQLKKATVFWCTIPYISKERRYSDNINRRIDSLNQFLTSLAKQRRFELIDLNTAVAQDGFLNADLTYDGIHLNGRGYLRWADSLANRMRKTLEKTKP
jgi:lysophospholipase L1-like esterase